MSHVLERAEVLVDTLLAPRRSTAGTRRGRRAERRRLSRADTVSSRLAELHAIGGVLAGAAEVAGRGWVQHGWFSVQAPGGEVVVTAHDVRLASDHPVTGACLVGAVVHAAGGPAAVQTQLVRRTLDLTWQALYEDLAPPRLLSSSPEVRMMRVRDLTRWNDERGRTRAQVVGLLRAAERRAAALADAGRAEQAALVCL